VLGESVRQSIYHHIERKCEVKRDQIHERIEDFHRALERIFGAGTRVVERLIAKNLYSRLNLNFEEHEDWTLVDYVNHAKKEFGRKLREE
jgi:hypothetical protein